MKKRVLYPIIAIVLTLSFPILVYAQGERPPVHDVPIDGGLSLLVAAGVGYGIKKVRDSRKEKKETDLLSK